ncbi:hypothetical protein CPA52_09050 [Pseudoalteromonas marina]|nr:hypothetical protein CPA52_09050 [Pseudoalteromonas marina]
MKFEVTETGHQIIQAEINGHTVNLILGTAADASVLDRACIKKQRGQILTSGIKSPLAQSNFI